MKLKLVLPLFWVITQALGINASSLNADQSPNQEEQEEFYISFHVKHPQLKGDKSTVGHIWVGLHRGAIVHYFGFYPAGVKSEKRTKGDVNTCYQVSQEEFSKAIKVINRFRNIEEYSVLKKNVCIDLAADVASAAGLQRPQRQLTQSPGEWLGLMISKNPFYGISCD